MTDDETALYYAVKIHSPDPDYLMNKKGLIHRLLERGVNVNTRGFLDRIPLHWVVVSIYRDLLFDLIELLVKEGSDVNIKDEFGSSSLDYAIELENNRIVEILNNSNN